MSGDVQAAPLVSFRISYSRIVLIDFVGGQFTYLYLYNRR